MVKKIRQIIKCSFLRHMDNIIRTVLLTACMGNSHHISRDTADDNILKIEFATRNAENARLATLKLVLHYVTWRYSTNYSLRFFLRTGLAHHGNALCVRRSSRVLVLMVEISSLASSLTPRFRWRISWCDGSWLPLSHVGSVSSWTISWRLN